MGKQIGHLGGDRHLRGYAELLGSKDEQSLQIAQAIMLVLSQDKRTLFSELENLSAKSFKKKSRFEVPTQKDSKNPFLSRNNNLYTPKNTHLQYILEPSR